MNDFARSDIPTYVQRDATLRVKIIDACGMTCTFCHNEGTPVAADNRRRIAEAFTPRGRSGRVSIYTGSNGATFLPRTIFPDEEFTDTVARLRAAMGLAELHLTGGEPTLHPRLAELITRSRKAGYRVCMTSNGEQGAGVLPACAEAGLDRVNFSVFGTTPAELAEVQHTRYRNTARAVGKIDALRESIAACEDHGIAASANLVVLDEAHIDRVHRVLDEYSPMLSVRLLNSLDHGQASLQAIDRILTDRGAVAEAHYVTAGVSGARTAYRLGDGRRIFVKRIRPVRLPDTCAGCRFNNSTDCQEGYYGLRLYRATDGRWMVGVCLQRMDLCQPLEEFLHSSLATEITTFREDEYARLAPLAAS